MSSTKRILVATVVALLMAACSNGSNVVSPADTDGAEAGTTSGAADGDAEEVAVEDVPESGVTADVIRVGWMGDLTGPTASSQAAGLRGTEAYFAMVNEEGGVLGRSLEVIALDDEFAGERAATNYRQLVDDDRVLAILNMGGGHISEALSADVESDQIPVVGLAQTTDTLLGNPYMFFDLAHYGDQAEIGMARLIERIGSSSDLNVAVVQFEAPGGDQWNAYVERAVTDAGGQYAGRVTVNPAQQDFATTLDELRGLVDSAGVNAVALHGSTALGLGLLTEMDRQGLALPIVGINTMAGQSIFNEGPEELLDQLEPISSYVAPDAETPDGTALSELQAFVTGSEWEDDAAEPTFTFGWANAMVVHHAILRAAETDGSVTRETLVNALGAGPFDVGGLTCEIDWTESNHSPCAFPLSWNGEYLETIGEIEEWRSEISADYGL